MRKIILSLLFVMMFCLSSFGQSNRQDKQYYQYALISLSGEKDNISGQNKCFITIFDGISKKGHKYKDNNGNVVCFDTWAAGINYLVLDGWEIFEDIRVVSPASQQFYVRKPITKEELQKMVLANTDKRKE